MKLIAIKWITDQLPVGAVFDIPDEDANSAYVLIEAGLARKDEAPAEPVASRRTYRRRDLKAEP